VSRGKKVINMKKSSNMDEWIANKNHSPKGQIKDVMIKGYIEMAEINLGLSEYCFEAEREVEQFFEQIAECE